MDFFMKLIGIFTASLEKYNVYFGFSEIVGCELQCLKFMKMLVHLRHLM